MDGYVGGCLSIGQPRYNVYLCVQCPMNGTAIRDFKQPDPLFVRQIPLQFDFSLDEVDQSGLGLTRFTVFRVYLVVLEPNGDPLQRPLLTVGIHAKGYGSTAPERSHQVVVGGRAEVGSAGTDRFICNKSVFTRPHFGLESDFSGVYDNTVVAAVGEVRMFQSRIFLCPRVDDRTDVASVFLVRQQMVGVIQGDKALGMTRFLINLAGVVDPDDFVDGAVEDDECAFEAADGLFHRSLLQVV